MERASGLRQTTCPWRAYIDPYVQSVIAAAAWAQRNDFGPTESRSAALVRGVEIYLSALNAVSNFDTQKRTEKLERENKERESASGPPGVLIRHRW